MNNPANLAKKLHRLVVSPNSNEATAAAQKLSALVRQHNLRLSDLDVTDQPQIVYRDRVVEVPKVVYRDRIIEVPVEVPVYRDRIVYRHKEVQAPPTGDKLRAASPLPVHLTGHHKVEDNMDLALQKCSCGEWFTDANFYRHMDTVYYAQRHSAKGSP